MPVLIRFICYLLAAICFAVAAVSTRGPLTRIKVADLIALGLLLVTLPPLWDSAEALES